MDSPLTLQAIGMVRSCFKQKFGIPRQSGLAPGATAVLDIFPPYGQPECFRAIEQYSHLWVIFHFHATASQGWHSTVRPPRLGGDKRIGVFATRSNFRPNPLGLSAVKLISMEFKRGHALLMVENHDLLDGSPIIDLKPYIGFADSIPEARSFEPPTAKLTVSLTSEVEIKLRTAPDLDFDAFRTLMTALIESDPRPAYLSGKPDTDSYAVPIHGMEFRFKVENGNEAIVYDIYPIG